MMSIITPEIDRFLPEWFTLSDKNPVQTKGKLRNLGMVLEPLDSKIHNSQIFRPMPSRMYAGRAAQCRCELETLQITLTKTVLVVDV